MRFRRDHDPDEDALARMKLASLLYFAFERALAEYGDLRAAAPGGLDPQARAHALDEARFAATIQMQVMRGISSGGFGSDEEWFDDSEGLPRGVLSAFPRVTYALAALAEADHEPEQLLTAQALDGLFADHQIEEWMAARRAQTKGMKFR